MKLSTSSLVLALLASPASALAQAGAEPSDEELLALYDGLRVADVVDGMDIVGLRDVGLVGTEIQPLWRDIDELDHQFTGIALTVRYVPHNRVVPNPMPPAEYERWKSSWYREISPEPFAEMIRPGHAIVIDASGDGDTGSIGSNNALGWVARGARGVVTNGSVRDTDEIIKQEIPLYVDHLERGRGIRPGRNMIESVNRPIEVGGALVRPGDVIVADGDGVVVVPREHAVAVAQAAHPILDADKEGRRRLYERLGRPLDETVR